MGEEDGLHIGKSYGVERDRSGRIDYCEGTGGGEKAGGGVMEKMESYCWRRCG